MINADGQLLEVNKKTYPDLSGHCAARAQMHMAL